MRRILISLISVTLLMVSFIGCDDSTSNNGSSKKGVIDIGSISDGVPTGGWIEASSGELIFNILSSISFTSYEYIKSDSSIDIMSGTFSVSSTKDTFFVSANGSSQMSFPYTYSSNGDSLSVNYNGNIMNFIPYAGTIPPAHWIMADIGDIIDTTDKDTTDTTITTGKISGSWLLDSVNIMETGMSIEPIDADIVVFKSASQLTNYIFYDGLVDSQTSSYTISGNQLIFDGDTSNYNINGDMLILTSSMEGTNITLIYKKYSGPIPHPQWRNYRFTNRSKMLTNLSSREYSIRQKLLNRFFN